MNRARDRSASAPALMRLDQAGFRALSVPWRPPVLWALLAMTVGAIVSVLAATAAADSTFVTLGTSLTRSGMDIAAVAFVGLALLGVLLPPVEESRTVTARADRLAVAAAGAWLVLVLAAIAFRAAAAFARPVTALGGAELVAWAAHLGAGQGMVLTATGAVVVLGCAITRMRRPDLIPARIPLAAALFGLITPAVTGHAGAADSYQVIGVLTTGLHVAAAALWVGGLGAVLTLVASHRDLLDATLPRFSRLAGACVAALAYTGGLTALTRPGWGGLLSTGYGLIVVLKTGCLAGLAVLGWLARRRLATGRTPVLRWAGYEVALMAATLGLAAALTQTSPVTADAQ